MCSCWVPLGKRRGVFVEKTRVSNDDCNGYVNPLMSNGLLRNCDLSKSGDLSTNDGCGNRQNDHGIYTITFSHHSHLLYCSRISSGYLRPSLAMLTSTRLP